MEALDYEEMAMAVQFLYEEELDNTKTDNKLLETASTMVKKTFDELSDFDNIKVSKEICKIYEIIN